MKPRLDTADLIYEIIHDPEARLDEARLLLGRRRHILVGINDNVIMQLKVFGALQDITPSLPLLRDLHLLLGAVADFAELDARQLCESVTAQRADSAKAIVKRCEFALARVEDLMQAQDSSEGWQ